MPNPLIEGVADRVPIPRRFSRVNEGFRRFAQATARGLGSPWLFLVGAAVCIGWLLTGPLLGYSATWQFFINDLTNVVTFLAVFLIQNTQNRDAKAIHLKLDELLRAMEGARNHMIDLEDLSDDELDEMEAQFKRIRRREARRDQRGVDVRGQ